MSVGIHDGKLCVVEAARVRIARWSGEAFLSFRAGYAFEVLAGYPVGSQIVLVRYDEARDVIEYVVEHESFDELAPGVYEFCDVPSILGVAFTRLEDLGDGSFAPSAKVEALRRLRAVLPS